MNIDADVFGPYVTGIMVRLHAPPSAATPHVRVAARLVIAAAGHAAA
jgi:hypothetical protein